MSKHLNEGRDTDVSLGIPTKIRLARFRETLDWLAEQDDVMRSFLGSELRAMLGEETVRTVLARLGQTQAEARPDGLLHAAKAILAKLDHPTASVTQLDADALRVAIARAEGK